MAIEVEAGFKVRESKEEAEKILLDVEKERFGNKEFKNILKIQNEKLVNARK